MPGGGHHRTNAFLKIDPDIGRPSYTFPKDRAAGIDKACAAPRAAAVNPKKK
jgi:hypothetical protein